jgi:TM2 domain-containing membrane protein YozV
MTQMKPPVVFPVTPMSADSSSEKFWPTFLLALFLGIFGAHRFYLKSPKRFLMLFTLGGLGIWAIIDVLKILLGKFLDAKGATIGNPSPMLSWALFVGLVIIAGADDKNKTTKRNAESGNVAKTEILSKGSIDYRYSGTYACTEGAYTGILSLYVDRTFKLKFGRSGNSVSGSWEYQGGGILVIRPDDGSPAVQYRGDPKQLFNEYGVYNKIQGP